MGSLALLPRSLRAVLCDGCDLRAMMFDMLRAILCDGGDLRAARSAMLRAVSYDGCDLHFLITLRAIWH